MEGSVTNLLSPGDQVVVVNGGKFGERWTKICQAYGLTVREVVVEWGRAVRPEAVKAALDEHPRVRALFVQASETSTCALHPVPALAEITRRRDVLLVVDGSTAVGVIDLPMDRLGIDVLVTGSQKALMLPPGLAFVALSERAWKATETARLPRFYFDFRRERKGVAERSTAWTPAISLVQGLRGALPLLRATGWANVHARHARRGRCTLAPEGLARLREQPELEIEARPGLSPAELRDAVRGFHALIIRSGTKVTADVLARADALRVIGRAGIGVDNVDVDAATKKGIVVMNTPGGSNVTTAEHAITLLLALARNVPLAAAGVRAGRWEREKWLGTEVCNKVLGIIGLGNIGTIVAERALGLRMKVIAYDPLVTHEVAARLRVELVSLDELYARADFVTIHTPLTPETRGLIGPGTLARMRRGVRIVNCARGGIVDEAALAAAIKSGQVAGAALDVLEQEPPPAGHPLLQLEQVICTPHLGASTGEAQVNVAVAIAQQVADFLCRGIIQTAVNVPSLSPEVLRVLRPYLLLAEKLGALGAPLLPGPPLEMTVQASGEVAERELRSLAAAVLRGLLGQLLESGVNYVNAPAIARERGIRVIEARAPQTSDYLNALSVQVRTAARTIAVEGAVFGADTVRVTKIDGFRMEAVPEGYILMLHNRDVPGVVGRVGTLLGERGINIAGIELGRERVGGMALSLIHVDEPVPLDVLDALRTLPQIVSAQQLRL